MYLKNELYELIKTDESIFDFIQNSSLDGLWYWDLENPENEWMNAKFWTVLGYNPDEMPHKSAAWQDIINQDDLKLATENFTQHCKNPNHPYDQVVRYTHKGSIEFGYKIVEAQCITSLQFYVKDTGIGISKDRQEAIFERFIQADIEDRMAYQGAGLGLAITKAFVEMLGGKIWVESEEGNLPAGKAGGSTFYFTLPYNTDSLAETIDQQPEPSGKDESARKLKILIAEDDEVSEMLIDTYINSFAREILKAKSGGQAVEVCRDNSDIDLILMDIQMPQIGGHEAAQQIREFNKEVIIIAQTAYGLTGDREKAIEAGCNDYIAKPIKKDALLALIQKYFGK